MNHGSEVARHSTVIKHEGVVGNGLGARIFRSLPGREKPPIGARHLRAAAAPVCSLGERRHRKASK
ncbi:hypothetical protein ACFQ0G_32965 [Streptomyces chiangmaiensis]